MISKNGEKGVITVNVEDYAEYKRATNLLWVAGIEDLPEFLTHKLPSVREYARRRINQLQRVVPLHQGRSVG